MNILKVTFKRNVLPAICLFFGVSTLALAQKGAANLSIRFAHPQYEAQTKTYNVDVEMKAAGTPRKLFGMNVRFFYDASELEFLSLGELPAGYGILGEAPKAFVGNNNSGNAMFNLDASAGYINSAIQLLQEDKPFQVPVNQWVKVFKARFKVPESMANGARLCPSLIWDMQSNAQEGGFFPGDNGVVITAVDENPISRQTTTPLSVSSVPFNWEYNANSGMPFGRPMNVECLTTGATTASQDVDENGYALFQNYPNPFVDNTVIEFVLPEAQEAKLIFSDVTGSIVNVIEGKYKAGKNLVKIDRHSWKAQGNVLFYRLETSGYTSSVLKMIRVYP